MKWYVPLAAALLLLVMSGSSSALLLLDWEQGRIGSSGVTMKLVGEDDPADDSHPATPEYLILELSNQKRRYVGVAITQVAPSSNEDPIMDNGDDDTYIVPASELISLSSALNVVGYDPWPSSRRYILPIKRQGGTIPPGVEYRFQGQIVGPGFGVRQDVEHLSNMTPWSLPTSDLWYGATGRTLLMVYGLPTLNMLSPGVSAKLQQISENQWVAWEIGIGLEKLCKELGPQIQDCLQRQDSKCLIDLGIETFDLLFLKTEAGKRVMEQWFKEHQIRTLTRHLDTLKDYLLTPATAAQLFNDVLLEPSSLAPLQNFEVVVIRPQVTDINPPMQDPGGIVTIHGKGFDPSSPLSKTSVRFTGQKEVNNIPSLRFDAQVIDIPDEESIKVRVPEEAVQGPIQVCDKQLTDILGPDFACSNTDVEYGAIQLAGIEAELTNEEGFEIEPGGPLLRVASFEVRVTNLTPDFVPTDWIVRLYVNGSPAKEKNLTDKADFKFWLDKDNFDPGSYRVHAEVNVAGRLLKTENFSFRVQGEADTPGKWTGDLEVMIDADQKTTDMIEGSVNQFSLPYRIETRAPWTLVRNGKTFKHEFTKANEYGFLSITIHGNIESGNVHSADIRYKYERYDGQEWFKKSVDAQGIEIDSIEDSKYLHIHFSVSGKEACAAISSIRYEDKRVNRTYNDEFLHELVPETMTCDQDSHIRVRLTYFPP